MASKDEGWIPAYRKLFEPGHHLALNKPVCPRFAWLDLCQMATRSERSVSYGYELIDLEPGELVASLRTLGERWSWDKMAVSRFLRVLEKRDSIKRQRETAAGTVYLIANKDLYWLTGGTDRDSSETGDDTGVRQERDKNKKVERDGEEKEMSRFLTESTKRGVYSEPFEALWETYPRNPNDSKSAGWAKYKARIRAGIPHDEMLAGAERYAAYVDSEGADPRFVKHLKTFLGPDEYWRLPYEPSPEPHANGNGRPPGRWIPGMDDQEAHP